MTDIRELERDLEELFALRAAAVRPCREPLTLTRQAQPQHRARWALASAVFVAVGVVGGSLLLIDRDETVSTEPEPTAPTSLPTTDAPIPTTATPPPDPFDQVVGLAPTAGIPEGWIVTHAAFAGGSGSNLTTRQLFGDPGAPQPMNRSVLIVSAVNPYGPTSAPTTLAPSDVIRGVAASIEAYPDGTLQMQWASGEVLHLATVRGMVEAEALTFIDSLQVRPEPTDGFDASPGTLVEVASDIPAISGQSSFQAFRPGGSTPDTHGPSIRISASMGSDALDFRALATPEPDGTLVIWQDSGGGHSVRVLRPDGWQVVIEVWDLDGGTDSVAVVDAIQAGLRPVTGRELIDDGRALPIVEETDVDGQHVTVHGVDGYERLICLGVGDAATCGLAAMVSGAVGAWILTDDGWVVAVRGEVLGEVSDPTPFPTIPPSPPTGVPDEWHVVDVRDDARMVTIGSNDGSGSLNRPLP